MHNLLYLTELYAIIHTTSSSIMASPRHGLGPAEEY